MRFGEAIECAQSGRRIARAGWNGKGMWVTYSPGSIDLPYDKFWSPQAAQWAYEQPNQRAEVLPCLIMKTADDKILMGWLASQTDMLADDWQIV